MHSILSALRLPSLNKRIDPSQDWISTHLMYTFTPKAPCEDSYGPTDTSTKGRRPGLTSMGSCNILCDEPPVGAAQDHPDHTNTFLYFLIYLGLAKNRWLPSHMANPDSMLIQCGWKDCEESASSIFKGSPLQTAGSSTTLCFCCPSSIREAQSKSWKGGLLSLLWINVAPVIMRPCLFTTSVLDQEFWGRATAFGMTLIILVYPRQPVGFPFKLHKHTDMQ